MKGPPVDSGRLALLSPSCRLPVTSLSFPWHFWPPVAPLPLACRFLVASLSLLALLPSCRLPFAFVLLILSLCLVSCCFPVATLLPPCRPPVALLSHLPCRLPVACLLLPVAFLPLSCRFPVVFLSPSYRLPVATLSPSCRSLPHYPIACLAWPEDTRPRSGGYHLARGGGPPGPKGV